MAVTQCAECGKGFEAKHSRARFCSTACRMRAHRRAEELAPSLQSKPAHENLVPADRPSSTEEEYVGAQVAITKAQLDQGLLKPVNFNGRGRLERAEAYARWRWREYHAGNVQSL